MYFGYIFPYRTPVEYLKEILIAADSHCGKIAVLLKETTQNIRKVEPCTIKVHRLLELGKLK